MKLVIEMVVDTVSDFINENDVDTSYIDTVNEDTALFGGKGFLDSIGVVMLLTELEERISEDFEVDLTLADEKAMSQRTSPFRSVGTLSKYIEELLRTEINE
ncbi:hypothetical protein [Dongshaea marina]|uniref:hypothetical protein n=1 Tax=Dongshaea marina TaxID=2047966 RepID=UPI0018FF390F|nr:hypothetical protein [Dongshaea marina]